MGLIHDLEDLLGSKVDVVTETGLKERIREIAFCEIVFCYEERS